MVISEENILQYNNWQTPFYVYNLKVLRTTLELIKVESSKYNYDVHYAFKANVNDEILKTILHYGFGADCVSGNEIKKAIEIGYEPNKIVFAGVGKSDEEIKIALANYVFCFNVESIQELTVIDEIAAKQNKMARIALRINPNVDAYTHHYITTGLEENKFGINEWELPQFIEQLGKLKNTELIGIHFHIGSLINDLSVFKNLCVKVNYFINWFEERRIKLVHINVGGGLGVDYYEPEKNTYPNFAEYFKIFNDFLEIRKGHQVHFELGRAIVAQCGSLISKVLYIKNGIKTNFAILDAGMTELIRPALYQSYHKIENLTKRHELNNSKYDVVGPICESSDCFGKALELPITERGDLIAIRTTGAYGEVMSSNYNLRENPTSYYTE